MATETLTHWFKSLTAETTANPIIYWNGHSIDQQTQALQIAKLVHYLQLHSVAKGHTIALITSSSWLVNLMIHASSELGVALYPLDPKLPEQWQQNLLDQVAADYLISCDKALAVDIDVNRLTISPLKTMAANSRSNTELAVVMTTSGSSSEPKGVMLDWPAIYHSAVAVNHRVDLKPTDCWLNCLPLHHIGGLSIIFRTMLSGASMVLHQGFNATQVWQDIQRYRVSHISLVPVMLAKLLDAADSAPPKHLRTVLIGGAALEQSLAKQALAAGWPLFVTYGMTETGSQIATRALTSVNEINNPIPLLAGIECSVVNDKGKLTKDSGRIRLRGELLMQGYANINQSKGDGIDAEGWYTTGDIGSYHEETGLQIIGRADDVIISGGENIHPQQVEQLLNECPGVDEIYLVGVDDPEWGEKVCAIYCGDISEQELEHWCRDELQGAQRPRLFLRLQHLPRLSSDKIDRQALKRLGKQCH